MYRNFSSVVNLKPIICDDFEIDNIVSRYKFVNFKSLYYDWDNEKIVNIDDWIYYTDKCNVIFNVEYNLNFYEIVKLKLSEYININFSLKSSVLFYIDYKINNYFINKRINKKIHVTYNQEGNLYVDLDRVRFQVIVQYCDQYKRLMFSFIVPSRFLL